MFVNRYEPRLRVVACSFYHQETPSLKNCLQDVDFGMAHTAGSAIDKIRISVQCVVNYLMEYAAYLRIVPFAAHNHAANAPALHGASRMSISV